MSKWKFWKKIRETPIKPNVNRRIPCPTCGRVDEKETRQSKLFEYTIMQQRTLEAYK
jgi:hypothetical protein